MRITAASGALVLVAAGLAVSGQSVVMTGSQGLQPGKHCTSPGYDRHGRLDVAHSAQRYAAWRARERQAGRSAAEMDRDAARELCIVPVATGPTYVLSSTSGDVGVSSSVGHDTQLHYYYSIGQWNWLDTAWKNDQDFHFGSTTSLSDADAAMFHFNAAMYLTSDSVTYWGNGSYFGTGSARNKSNKATQYGEAYRFQDKVWDGYVNYVEKYDMNSLHGEMVVQFHAVSGCHSNFQAFFDYGHDWSSTTITGISIGLNSFGISWSTSVHSFEATRYSTTPITVCAAA